MFGELIQGDLHAGIRRLMMPEQWISRGGLIATTIITLVLGIAVASLVEVQAAGGYSLIRVGIVLSVVAVGIAGWVLTSQAYLRTGKGVKVGVVDTLPFNEVKGWQETRAVFAELARQGVLRDAISLRLVPPESVRTPESIERFARRYRFELLIRIQIKKEKSSQAGNIVGTVINKRAIEDSWTPSTIEHINRVMQRRAVTRATDLTEVVARNLAETMIWLTATRLVALNRPQEAAPLVLELERRLEKEFGKDETPRAQIRWLYKACHLGPSMFNLSEGDMPPPEELDEMERLLHIVCDFDPEDPGPHIQIARVQFMRGDIPGAVMSVNRAEQASTPGSEPTALFIGQGFLNLIDSNFDAAAKAFRRFLDAQSRSTVNFHDLVEFADLCHEWGHPHVCFVQDLYRRLAGVPVPTELQRMTEDWLNKDASRRGLLHVRNQVINATKKAMKERAAANKLATKLNRKSRTKRH